jgi:hypothetical protein
MPLRLIEMEYMKSSRHRRDVHGDDEQLSLPGLRHEIECFSFLIGGGEERQKHISSRDLYSYQS